MNILALDTASEVLSAALETGTGVWYMETDAGKRHSELLMECADTLCKTAGIAPGEINAAACMKGPGSFTGLRIGFSAAKGLAKALEIPLITVPTLDCLAYPLSVWPGLVIPVIDAKKDCFFTSLYRGAERLTDYMDVSAEKIAQEAARLALSPEEPAILTGSGADLCGSRLANCHPYRKYSVAPGSRRGSARELLALVKSGKFAQDNDINGGPIYLRKSDAELNYT